MTENKCQISEVHEHRRAEDGPPGEKINLEGGSIGMSQMRFMKLRSVASPECPLPLLLLLRL
jgi:hypothetical protein